MSNVSKKYIG